MRLLLVGIHFAENIRMERANGSALASMQSDATCLVDLLGRLYRLLATHCLQWQVGRELIRQTSSADWLTECRSSHPVTTATAQQQVARERERETDQCTMNFQMIISDHHQRREKRAISDAICSINSTLFFLLCLSARPFVCPSVILMLGDWRDSNTNDDEDDAARRDESG